MVWLNSFLVREVRLMNINDIFLAQLPKIDLHGFDRDSARVAVNDFIDEAIAMGYDEILIIHGIGSGIVKNVVRDVLTKRKDILKFHLVPENIGCTIVVIK